MMSCTPSFASSASCRPVLPRWFAFHSRISVVCPWSPTATSTTSPNRAQSLGFFRSVFPPPLIPKMPWKLRVLTTKYVYIYIYIYICIERERERERFIYPKRSMCLQICFFAYIHISTLLYRLIQRPNSSLSQVDYRHWDGKCGGATLSRWLPGQFLPSTPLIHVWSMSAEFFLL